MWKRSMISASVDVMGPDNGTTNKTMNIIKDQYKLLLTTNSVDIDNVVVGKSPNFGGLEAYNLSQGLGIACAVNYLVQNITASKKVHQITHLDISKHKKSIIVQGFGKAGYHSAKRLYESGFYKIIGITNGSKAIYNPIGFHPDKVNKYFNENKTIENYPAGENLSTNEVLSRKCDIVIATMGEHSVCKDVAQNLKCKFFVEGRSVPQTEEAEEIIKSKDIIVIPDLLASSGTHVCGYIEWLKNLEHRNLTMLFKRHESKVRQEFINMLDSSHNHSQKGKFEGPTENDLVESAIEEMIFTSFEKIVDESLTNDIDLRTAAYKISLEKMYSFFDENRII
jgi:glutamate dehydrogenase (NAD(P)+)